MSLKRISSSRSDLYGSIFPISPSLKSEDSRIIQKSEISNISSTRPVVIYITGDDDEEELRSCEALEEIFQDLNVASERKVVSSLFLSKLNEAGFVACPRIFFRGRYVGGDNEVSSLKYAGELATSGGVCTTCGGYKYTLTSTEKLIPCKACHESAYQRNDLSISQGSHTRLFICFEGEDRQQRHIYVICSLDAHQPFQHTITTEAVIVGNPFMGFGVYDSKIVLAGGLETTDYTTHNGCITFDMKTHVVDYNPFMLMSYGKYKPLLFQLGKRLYVCDSQYVFTDQHIAPIEMYSPAIKTKWHTMANIFSSPNLLTNYSCLVFGNTCFMSAVPSKDDTWMTHCNYRHNQWLPYSDTPLPFTGVATFHAQDGFDDFVMIYFDKGAVRVCQFDLTCFGDSQELFRPHESDENVQGYFADFGKGCFCLTTFDKFHVYLWTFVVTREGTSSDPLKVTYCIQNKHTFYYHKLFSDGMKITSVVGCSVLTQNEEAKSLAEKAESIFFKSFRKINEDYDLLEFETMDYKSLILKDVEWLNEIFSEGEETLASDNHCEEDLACDDKCEQD